MGLLHSAAERILRRVARSIGVTEIQQRLDALEASKRISPELYMKLEARFRGDLEVIKARQSQYIPFVEHCITPEHPALDLGCGRGEWLTVLRDHGLHGSGIDGNRVAVDACRKSGLLVECDDIFTALKRQAPQSLGCITLFQVLEHLPFELVLEILELSRAALIDGGVLIAEIPNSKTLRVGASTFWIDPTHERPLFPDVLQFLAQEARFTVIRTQTSTPLTTPPDLSGVSPEIAKTLLEIHSSINGDGDFAIIATR
jgi:O-antigen chain-terminating methyltransferase